MRKVISLLMALLMVLSLLPTAWAANVDDTSFTAEEAAQQEEAEEVESVPAEEVTEAPEDTTAEPVEDTEPATDQPAVLAAGSSVDEQLKAAGFVAAPIPEAGNANVAGAAWFNIPGMSKGLVTVSYEGSTEYCRHMTFTIHKGTLEQWQSLYRSLRQDGYYHSIWADVFFNAPSNATRGVKGSYYIIPDNEYNDDTASLLNDFTTDNLDEHMNSYDFSGVNGYQCIGDSSLLASVDLQDGKAILSAEAGEESYRSLIVWDNNSSDDGRLYKYNFIVTIKVEANIHYEWTEKSVMDELFDRGYAAPVLGRDFGLEMPDGLVENVDYRIDYNKNTGVLNIQLLPGEMSHWQQAYQTLLEQYEASPDEYPDYFYISMGFPNPSGSGNKVLMYPNDNGYGFSNFVNGNDDWLYAYDAPSGYYAGWSTTWIGNAWEDDDNYAHVAFYEGISYSEYLVVSYANKNYKPISGKKFAIDVTIEVPEAFDYQWNTKTLDDKLADAGFIAPEADDVNTEMPGSFSVGMPAGLVEGTDYKCTYDSATGELVITLLRGNVAHWKSAYLDSIISGDGDRVFFSVYLRSTDGAVSCAQWCGKDNYEQLLESDSWDDVFDFSFDSAICGQGLPIADTQENSNGKTAISVSAGTERYYYGVIWTDSAGQTTKYLLKVTIQSSSSFTHTVTSPEIRKLDTSIAGGRFALTAYNPNGISTTWTFPAWENGNIALIPRSGLTLADITNNESWIGSFSAAAPAKGYTLQSCYIDYFAMGNELVRGFDTDENGAPMLDISVFDITTGGSARYVLRWHSSSTSQADIVELLDVRVDGQPRGKLSSSGGDVNIQDVQAIYEYLTQDTVPYAGETACDVNMDGNMDVYDLQRLYECVALGKTL